jgi:hypothetical protein
MDILTLKNKNLYADILKQALLLFRYKNNIITLQGSSSFKFLDYSADFDLITAINKYNQIRPTPEKIYYFLINILKKLMKDDNFYLIELKIQYNNDNKIKFHINDKIKLDDIVNDYNNISFIKIDLIVFTGAILKELSIIYKFDYFPLDNREFIELVKIDYNEYIQKKKYFKAIKRLFIIEKINNNNKKKISLMFELFNSKNGHDYQIASNIETIILLLSYYKDYLTLERVKNNLKNLGMKPTINIIKLENDYKNMMININNHAFNYLKLLLL